MKLHKTTDPNPNSETELLHIYNGLDCCITLEVLQALIPQLDKVTSKTYDFSLAFQAPVLEMECRGVLVDREAIVRTRAALEKQVEQIEDQLREILEEGVGITVNWNSPVQLLKLFYSVLGLPVVRFQGKPTVNRQALEKLKGYFYAEPIVNHILSIRDLKKKIGVLKTGIDSDGRIRTSYNIAGTDTGRLSSYASSFGSGTNLQNITGELRSIFVADRGYKLAYIDLEQAESRAVGGIVWNLFQDGSYLDACESGDLHTTVSMLCWDYLGWTSDRKQNKVLASQPFYRHFTYRDAAKRLGHGTNYFGKPPNMARQTHIDQQLVANFQVKYFEAFNGIQEWHKWTRAKLNKDGWITSLSGRRRWFFGRRWDEETLRAAIAYDPQGTIADILNRGLLQLWRADLPIQLLLQVHDAIVFQYKEELENEIVPLVMETMKVELPLLHGRSLLIPTEAQVGWNWAYANKDNVDGLVKFNGNDTRKRSAATKVDLMDRLLR